MADNNCRHQKNKKIVFQLIGGALFISAAESVFANGLLSTVPTVASGADPQEMLHTDSTNIRAHFSEEGLPGIPEAYMVGLKAAWALGLALACVAFMASSGPKGKRMPQAPKEKESEDPVILMEIQ